MPDGRACSTLLGFPYCPTDPTDMANSRPTIEAPSLALSGQPRAQAHHSQHLHNHKVYM